MSQQSAKGAGGPGAFGQPGLDIVFLCLARNCAHTLPNFFSFLRDLQNADVRVRSFVGENNSSDNTAGLLQQAGNALAIERVDTAFMASEPERLTRMALGRQFLLEYARSRCDRADFVCVADLDNVFAGQTGIQPLLRAAGRLAKSTDLFAIGATSRPVYYDILSLRTRTFSSAGLHRAIQQAKRNPLTYYRFHQKQIWDVQEAMTSDREITCISSFNGLCLYRAEPYFAGTYRAPNEAEVCEHVTLNEGIASATGTEMMISPELVVSVPMDHARVGLFTFWKDRLRKL